MMKRLGALLGLWPLIWTMDFDGEVRLRIAHRSNNYPFSEGSTWWCYGIGFFGRVRLLPDQSCKGSPLGSGYVKQWMEWHGNRVHVRFPHGGDRMMRDPKDIERAIAHCVDAGRGARAVRDIHRFEALMGLAAALRWVLGEEGDFSELLKAFDVVDGPPAAPPVGRGPN